MVDWEKLVAEGKYVGGDMEAQEDGDVYRGPIKRIWIEGPYVYIQLEWCGKLADRQTPWRKHHITENFFRYKDDSMAAGGRMDADGRVIVHISMIGTMVLFPRGGSKLDPAKVEGLVVDAPKATEKGG